MNFLIEIITMAKAQKKQPIDPMQQQNNEMIRDVEESLRQDQLKALWDQYGSTAITIAVAIVLFTAATSGWQSWESHSNQQSTDALITALDGGELENYVQSHKGTHKTIATLGLAGKYAKDGKREEAASLYKAIADDKKNPDIYRDLGSLLYATTSTEKNAQDKLVELSQKENSPWAPQAGLELALIEGEKGNIKEALEILTAITENENTPTATRQKATALTTLYTLKENK